MPSASAPSIDAAYTGATQVIAANATSQLLTFVTTGAQTVGQLLINNAGTSTAFINVDTANTVTASVAVPGTPSNAFPVLANASMVVSTGQVYNQNPGNVYVAVISSGTANVYITPVSAL